MSHEKVANKTHIGRDVPDEIAFPLILSRLREHTVITPSGCWESQRYANAWTGYVAVFFRGKKWTIHRLSYFIHKGATQLDICHTCDNKRCWNPSHLWAGTHRENMIDHVIKGRHYESQKIVCLRGHPLSGENVDMQRGGRGRGLSRKCKKCQRARQRINAGWPADLAYTMETLPFGYRLDRRTHQPKKVSPNPRAHNDSF
jgi:hypothetical protein